MAAGAHAILIPEQKTSMEQIAKWVRAAYDRGRAPLVVVAEGFVPDHEDTRTPSADSTPSGARDSVASASASRPSSKR